MYLPLTFKEVSRCLESAIVCCLLSSNDDRSIDTQTYGLEQNTSEEDERDAVDIPIAFNITKFEHTTVVNRYV